MNLALLQYIVTIAEEKGLARAAARLNITPSALSQSVKKLEGELNIPIFEKINSHTFQLTSGGKIYVEAAERILKIRDETYLRLEDTQRSNRTRFVFGCSPRRGLAMLTNVFPPFHKKYPNVQIELRESYLNTLLDCVIEGSVDIAVLTPLSDEHHLVELEILDTEEIVLAIPADHPHTAELTGDAQTGTISYSDLHLFRHDNWMLSNKDSMHRNLTDDILKKVGFYPERVLLETSSTTPHIAAVEAGIAVSLVPVPQRPGPNTRLLHLEPKIYRTLYAAYRKSYILSDSQRDFIDSIRQYYRSEKNDLE
ncbi:MAG: LysR family transcriptional regulator [Sphaerochaetaceae bacterium]|nr:LysR family transcriptional regulator [Sphaerochaetaceae bacterium]